MNALKVGGATLAALALTACSTTTTTNIATGGVTAWKCEPPATKKNEYVYTPYNFIIQAPGDIIAGSTSESKSTTVILNTSDKQELPDQWRISQGYSYKSLDDGGFAVTGNSKDYSGKSINQSISLNPVNGKLRIENGSTKSYLECKRAGNWETLLANVTTGPGKDYLGKRLSQIPFLRSKAGDYVFNQELAKEAYARNDFKSAYNLLAPMPVDKLTTEERDILETSKNKIIENDTSTYNAWEWNNSWQGGISYTDEEKSSRCNSHSSSPSQEGYSIISSTPQDRIAGYNLTCHGTLHLMKKQGTLSPDKPAELFPAYYD